MIWIITYIRYSAYMSIMAGILWDGNFLKMDTAKILIQHVAFSVSFFAVSTIPQQQIILFPILAVVAMYFVLQQQAWKFPFKFYNRWNIFRVGIIGLLTYANLAMMTTLTQVFDPVLLFISIPNFLFISAIVKAVKGQRSIYTMIGLVFWMLMIGAAIYNFGLAGTIMGMVLSITLHIRDRQMTVFEDSKKDYKIHSYVYLVASFLAVLGAVATLEFQLYFDTPYQEFKPLFEFLLIVGACAASICMSTRKTTGDGLFVISAVVIIGKFVMIQTLAPAVTLLTLGVIATRLLKAASDALELPLGHSQKHLSLIGHIMEHSDSRSIAMFLIVNLAFMFVEALYGYWCNSLGLISDAAHMAFDCTALFIGLYASYMAKFSSDKKYSYGYARFEVLSGFLNGVFLLWVAWEVLIESVERLMQPPEVTTENLLLVSVLGLIVNLIGLYSFHGDMGGENMQGVFLHVLADTLGSVGVIISSILVELYGWYVTDPMCSTMISLLIFASTFPLISESGKTLIQHSMKPKKFFRKTKTQIAKIPGVKEIPVLHTWQLCQGKRVCSIQVAVEEGISHQKTKEAVRELLHDKFESLTIEVSKEKVLGGQLNLNGNKI